MKYFFSAPSSSKNVLEELNVHNVLMSYAVDAKNMTSSFQDCNIIIDSGAFSVWNKGGKIDIDDYISFCKTLPEHYVFVNVDVIPETGSSSKEINRCAEEGFENYKYISSKLKKVLPVYHYGEHLDILKRYMDYTDYIGLSPANDTHEKVKRNYLKTCFNLTRDKVKTHGFGYSSHTGMLLFPFYSVDSISYKRYTLNKGTMYWAQGKLGGLLYESVRTWLYLEKQITNVWEKRGIKWD